MSAPTYAIVIPFRDKVELVNECLATFARHESDAAQVSEILLVDNGSTTSSLSALRVPTGLKQRTLRVDEPFNFQRLMNVAAKAAEAPFLLLLNSDIVFTKESTGALEKLRTYAARPDVGAVGPLLYYPDGTLQHAGAVVGMGGFADHLYRAWTVADALAFNFTSPFVDRYVSAVTAACMLVERKKFLDVGGFDERFIVCGGDVDFCIRLHERGLKNVYVGTTSLVHLESKSRDANQIPPSDFTESTRSYSKFLGAHGGRDPYYPAPLSLDANAQYAAAHRAQPDVTTPLGQAKARLKHARHVAMKAQAKLRNEPIEEFVRAVIVRTKGALRRPGENPDLVATPRDPEELRISNVVPIRFHREAVVKARPRLNVLLPHLMEASTFGGITTAILIAFKTWVAHRDFDIRFVLTEGPGDANVVRKLMRGYFGAVADDVPFTIVEAADRSKHSLHVHERDRFLATAWWTTYSAYAISRALPNPRPFLYLVQDYEPCFYAWGDGFAVARGSYEFPSLPIFNSSFLREYFRRQHVMTEAHLAQSTVFEPAVSVPASAAGSERPRSKPRKTLFVYGRPSVGRNLFGTSVLAVSRAIELGTLDPEQWDFVSAGEPHQPYALARGAVLRPLGKMTLDEYWQFLKTVDLGVSLMLSPHPSYPPLEVAVSGGLCVTNGYDNKDLSTWHSNILSCSPTVESVAEGIERAVKRISSGDAKKPPTRDLISRDWDASLKDTLVFVHRAIASA